MNRSLPLLLVAATLATVGLPTIAHHFQPIQPGALYHPVPGQAGWCTMNFIFRDAAGDLYAGSAGHCHRTPLGTRVNAPDIGEFGTLVYVEELSDPLAWMDFALLRIDPDKHGLVDPAMRVWGGPTGVQTVFTPGTPTLLYGHPVYVSATEASRALRPGVLEYVKEDPNWVPNPHWAVTTNPVYSGNSGGPIITADGQALTLVSLIAVGDKGLTEGPTIAYVLQWLARDGWDLELVTAPFSLPDAAQAATVGMVEHCQANPLGDAANPDACIVPPQ